MKFFLHIKAWQLFLLIVLLPFLSGESAFGKVIYVIWVACYIGWIYAVGIFMHKILDVPLKPGVKYFQFSCLFIVLTIICITPFGGVSINQDNYEQYGSSLWLKLAFIFYMLWSMLYIFMFAARMLQSVIEERLVYRSDSLRPFLGFWFFPFGVWYIQPDVQMIMMAQRKKIKLAMMLIFDRLIRQLRFIDKSPTVIY